MRDFIDAVEQPELLSFWDAASELGCDKAAIYMHDLSLPWINQNKVSAVRKCLADPDIKKVSQLKLYIKHVLKEYNFAAKVIDLDTYETALNQTITLWRGGGEIYDPNLPTRSWVSFTAKRGRAETFSRYNGTYASRAYKLPERRNGWWIVELEIPIREILLYFPHGNDEEVIVPKAWSKKARVVMTHEGPVDA